MLLSRARGSVCRAVAHRAVRTAALCRAMHAGAGLRQQSPAGTPVPAFTPPASALGLDRPADAAEAGGLNEEEGEEFFEDPRPLVLDAALKHVKTEGWSKEALAAGARDAGYPSVSQGMFPHGGADLVWHVMRRANEAMSRTLAETDLASMPVNARITAGVWARLMYLAPYMRAWPQAVALGALPQHLPNTLRHLAVAADEVWWFAGDRSTDLNWYSRRLLLLGVYATTETYMLTDASAGYADTQRFLASRLADVTTFGKTAGQVLHVTEAVAGGVGSILAAGFDIVRPAVLAFGQALPAIAPVIPLPSIVTGGIAAVMRNAAAAAPGGASAAAAPSFTSGSSSAYFPSSSSSSSASSSSSSSPFSSPFAASAFPSPLSAFTPSSPGSSSSFTFSPSSLPVPPFSLTGSPVDNLTRLAQAATPVLSALAQNPLARTAGNVATGLLANAANSAQAAGLPVPELRAAVAGVQSVWNAAVATAGTTAAAGAPPSVSAAAQPIVRSAAAPAAPPPAPPAPAASASNIAASAAAVRMPLAQAAGLPTPPAGGSPVAGGESQQLR